MFSRRGRQSAPGPGDIRDTLFGDMPLSAWPGTQRPEEKEPWVSFISARTALNNKDTDDAIGCWQHVTDMPGLEVRHYLQAWHFLRQAGIQPPPDRIAFLYGVVVEVAMVGGGLDLLAVYADGTGRYYNHTGSGVVWDRPSASLDTEVSVLLEAGRSTAAMVGIWEGTRPPLPAGDQARISMLTAGGLRFGQGTLEALTADPASSALLNAATALMIKVTALARP